MFFHFVGPVIGLLCLIFSIIISIGIFNISWNYVIPQVFHLKKISFKEAFLLIFFIWVVRTFIIGKPLFVYSYSPDAHII